MGTVHSISSHRPQGKGITGALPALWAAKVRTAREIVEERRRAGGDGRLATALPAVDRLLAGGLERGAMTELVGRRSSGRFAFVLSALAAVTGAGEAAALIDLGDGFDPQAAAHAGVDLERLLWVRPRRMKDVLASAEVILGTGMPLVVIELGLPPLRGGRGAEAAWLRLARSARAHRAALLVASPYRVSGTAAQEVLEVPAARGRWHGPLGGDRGGVHGRGRGRRLLGALETEVEVVKSRRQGGLAGVRGVRAAVSWHLADARFGASQADDVPAAAPFVEARAIA
jgi:hypothetical protein